MGLTLTLIGVEDWHGPKPGTKSETHEDAFDFTSADEGGETAGMLLPAVLTVREGRSTKPAQDEDSFVFKSSDEDGEAAGLLLPAVQTLNDGSRRIDDEDELMLVNDGDGSDGPGDLFIKSYKVSDATAEDVTPMDALVVINEIDAVL